MKIELIRTGEKIIYHTGYLAKDREYGFSSLKRNEAIELDTFAKKLWQESKKGAGLLTQRKIETGIYAYFFTKTAKQP